MKINNFFQRVVALFLSVVVAALCMGEIDSITYAKNLDDIVLDGKYQDVVMNIGDTFSISEGIDISGYDDGEYRVDYSEYYDSDVISFDEFGIVTALGIGNTSISYTVYYSGYIEEDAESSDSDVEYGDDDFWDWFWGFYSLPDNKLPDAQISGKKNKKNKTYVEDKIVLSGTISIHVCPTMEGVRLSQKKAVVYIHTGQETGDDWFFTPSSKISIDLVHDRGEALDENNSFATITCDKDNITANINMISNAVEITVYGKGKTKATLNINGREYRITLVAKLVEMNTTGDLIAPGKSKKLTVKNANEDIKWKSLDKSIATVNNNGVVKAKKKIGNVVITATVGNVVYGCAISVVPQKIIDTVNRGKKIGQGTYSQDNRMKDGYYDCSSLVWRAYSPSGVYMGSTNWAPTSKAQGKYCSDNEKMLKGGLSYENLTDMKFMPGDLYFETNNEEKPLDGIYHVEMIAGYDFYYMDYEGNPVVGLKWANRGNDYYWYDGGMVGRPYLQL